MILIYVSFAAFPIYWMVMVSLKSTRAVLTETPVLIVLDPSIDSYVYVINDTKFVVQFLNTLLLATTTTAITLVVASLAAYALSRFQFRAKRPIMIMLLASNMLPVVLFVIPLLILMRTLHLFNTYYGLILTYTTFTLPFAAWMLKGYFDAIPREIEEAALTDGCTNLECIRKIVLPVAAPGLVATSVYSFLLAWQDYIWNLTLTSLDTMRTLNVGINSFLFFREYQWPAIMAYGVLSTVPVILVFLYLQKFLVSGLFAGGVKG